MEEHWRPVPGYEGWYEVSDLGNVMSLPRATTRGRMLKPQVNSKGYRHVGLSKYGKTRTFSVGLLVLQAFRPPRPPDCRACHGSSGRLDDSLANLYWGRVRRAETAVSPVSRGGEHSVQAKLTDEAVLDCRRRYAAGEAQIVLAAEYHVSTGAMNKAIHGKTWSHLTENIPDPAVDGRSLISTPEMKARRREFGRSGARARWGTRKPPAAS